MKSNIRITMKREFPGLELTHKFNPSPLVHGDSENFQNAFQIVIVEKSNIKRTLALPITQLHPGSEPFPQFVLQIAQMRIAHRRWCGWPGFPILKLRNQLFRLPDVQRVFQDAIRRQLLFPGGDQAENHLGVTDGEAPVADQRLQLGGKFQQAQRIRHDRTAFSDLRRRLFLPELKLFNQLRIAQRLLDWVEIFALKILNERQFQNSTIIRVADYDRYFQQAGELRRAPAAFPGDQFESNAVFPNDERLNDSLLLD